MDFFGSHNASFFFGEPSIVALYLNLFKIGKSEIKIETYVLIFQTQKKKFTKRISVQFKVDFTKDGTSNVTIQSTPKHLSLWIFLLLVGLETKPITFYHHTLKYHST
jgi:hypothetical protein